MFKPDEKDFQIDRFRLDDEWCRQPNLYHAYAEALAEAKQNLDEAKSDAAVMRAEVELKIRKDPDDYNLPKVTEGVIKAALDANEELKSAEQVVIDARYHVGILEAAVQALDHRKRALSDLVSLHLADYYSKPVARGDSREAVEDMSKQRARRPRRRGDDD